MDRCTRNSTKEVSCPAVTGEGEDPGGRRVEQRWSWRRLWRLGQKSARRTPVMEHSSGPPGAGGSEGGARNSLTVAVTGPQGRTWLPGQGLLPVWVGRTVSQRRAVDTWVVEGTEVLVSTVALFGEVSADGAAGFVCEQAKIGQLKM